MLSGRERPISPVISRVMLIEKLRPSSMRLPAWLERVDMRTSKSAGEERVTPARFAVMVIVCDA